MGIGKASDIAVQSETSTGDPSLRAAPRRVPTSRASLQILVLFQSNIHSRSMSGS